jgi:uncharacterized protein YceK
MKRTWLFLCIAILFLAGCSSIAYRATKEKTNLVSPGIFPGVRTNVEYLLPGNHGPHPELDPFDNSLALMALVDMPLTFAADTLFLPHDLFEKRPPPEKKEEPVTLEEPAWETDPADRPPFGD